MTCSRQKETSKKILEVALMREADNEMRTYIQLERKNECLQLEQMQREEQRQRDYFRRLGKILKVVFKRFSKWLERYKSSPSLLHITYLFVVFKGNKTRAKTWAPEWTVDF